MRQLSRQLDQMEHNVRRENFVDYNLYIALPEEDLREVGICERKAEWGGKEIPYDPRRFVSKESVKMTFSGYRPIIGTENSDGNKECKKMIVLRIAEGLHDLEWEVNRQAEQLASDNIMTLLQRVCELKEYAISVFEDDEIIERRIKYTCGQDIFSFIREALDWESPQNMEIYRSMKVDAARILQKMKGKNIQRNDVLSIADVADFEKNAGIRLPEELVLFYTEVCNGCKMLDGFDLLKMEQWKYDADSLKRDFPFEKYWVWENDDDCDQGKIKAAENGNLVLIDIGDAQSWNIIVQGKERGRMWFFTDVGIQPCAPPMGFLEWFEFWLDGKDDFFYGFQPGK